MYYFRYNTCGIAKERIKSLKIPKSFPNLVDMTGLRVEDTDTKSMERLLDMIIMGYIPDKTSIPALQDVQRTRGSSGIWRHFPFMYDKRRINKILFVASATEPVPRELIDIVKRVAQPDGSANNLNPRCKSETFIGLAFNDVCFRSIIGTTGYT